MLAKERLYYILDQLQKDQAIDIHTLASDLKVSLSTVQRDLKKLEDSGQLMRERGGAVAHSFQRVNQGDELVVEEKILEQKEAKEIIARKAVSCIQDGETIFVDSGTTTLYMVEHLVGRNVQIVTNSLYLVSHFRTYNIPVTLIGGTFNPKYNMTWGSKTISEVSRLHFDRAFLSANGYSLEEGKVYVVEADNGLIKEMVLRRSKNNYLLVDTSKSEIQATYAYADTLEFTSIITEEGEVE